MNLSKSDITRFWSHVEKSENCWNWTANKARGYGHFWLNDKTVKAHRVSFLLANGYLPQDLNICHHCDNKRCVNPEHLFAGTDSDNIRDAFSKGICKPPNPKGKPNLSVSGWRNGNAKLNERKVFKVCELRKKGLTYSSIANQLGVSPGLIGHIIRRRAWKHLDLSMQVNGEK